jgi:hypothetical protein
MRKLGTLENPCKNNYEIKKIIIGMRDCIIFTLNTFEISEENLEQAKARNIIFEGLGGAYWKTPTIIKGLADAEKKENMALIGIDANTKIPINLDEIEKQINSRLNINVNESLEKTATQLKQEYENKYLGRLL